jgi:predicted O-methyltransferase YrrM
MENVITVKDREIVLVPLDHRAVLQERPTSYIYSAVKDRIERDRSVIDSFISQLRPFCYHENYAKIPLEQAEPMEPFLNNGYFSDGDARALYGIVAAIRPTRIIEIGSGNSTKFMRRAIRDFSLSTHVTSIDPQPRAEIDQLCDTVIRTSVLGVDLDLFRQLGAGDLLFHDGSHLTLNGTDTVRLFLEILPVLQAGVIIHIHDICLPHEYVNGFDGRGYSEQYMLAAALLFSRQYEVLLPVCYLGREQQFEGGVSFWFRKVA